MTPAVFLCVRLTPNTKKTFPLSRLRRQLPGGEHTTFAFASVGALRASHRFALAAHRLMAVRLRREVLRGNLCARKNGNCFPLAARSLKSAYRFISILHIKIPQFCLAFPLKKAQSHYLSCTNCLYLRRLAMIYHGVS